MKKGDICWTKNFQDFGESIIQLERRLIKNVDGDLLKHPIWEGYLLDCEDKDLMIHYYNKSQFLLIMKFEHELKKLNTKDAISKEKQD